MTNDCKLPSPSSQESLNEKLKKIETAMSLIKMGPENDIHYERDGDLIWVHEALHRRSV